MPRIPVLRVHRATNQAFVRIAGKFHYLGVSGSPQVFERHAALVCRRLGCCSSARHSEAIARKCR